MFDAFDYELEEMSAALETAEEMEPETDNPETDECEIENVDIVIRPYEYKPGKLSAYVKEMYVTIVQSRFEEKYDDMYDPEDDNLPF